MMTMNRRTLLQHLGAAGLALGGVGPALGQDLIQKPIPATGELLPTVGLGSWQSFDVAPGDSAGRKTSADILRGFFSLGGSLVDSSPMYGNAQGVIGQALREIGNVPGLFSATKVWTSGRDAGIRQMEEALQLWGVEHFDLLQVHNLVDWQTHLEWLAKWKEEGLVRYTGITTSHGSRHSEVADLLRNQPFDFVQLTYSMSSRQAERQLLPLAQDQGKAVIVNRAFEGGSLFRKVSGKSLPDFAADIDCESWAQFFLKFVISHPAVTCVIPATSRMRHLEDNMAAMRGRLPDADQRREMIRYFESVS